MPRYFFDTHNGVHARDDVGMELFDASAAKTEAMHRAAWFSSDGENLEQAGVIVVAVRDDRDRMVVTVRLVCTIDMTDQAR